MKSNAFLIVAIFCLAFAEGEDTSSGSSSPKSYEDCPNCLAVVEKLLYLNKKLSAVGIDVFNLSVPCGLVKENIDICYKVYDDIDRNATCISCAAYTACAAEDYCKQNGTTTTPKTTTKHPKTTTVHPKSTTKHPKSTTKHPKSTTKHPKNTTGHPKPTTAHSKNTTGHPKPTTAHPKSTTKGHPKPTTAHPKSTTGHPKTTKGYQKHTTGHSKNTTGHPKPTTAHPKSTTKGHPKPTTAHPKSTTKGHPKPTTAHSKNTTGHPKPTTAHPKSTTKGHPKPTTAHPKSTTKGHPKPTTAHSKNTTGHPKPTTAHPKSTTKGHPKPTTAHPKSTTKGHPKPTTAHPKSTTGHSKNTTGHPKPTTAHPKSTTKGHPKPTTAHPKSTTGHSKNTTGHPKPTTAHPKSTTKGHPKPTTVHSKNSTHKSSTTLKPKTTTEVNVHNGKTKAYRLHLMANKGSNLSAKGAENTTKCYSCEHIMYSFREETRHYNKDKIKKSLKSMCTKQDGKYKPYCLQLIKTDADLLVTMLYNRLPPPVMCNKLKQCSFPYCDPCIGYTTALKDNPKLHSDSFCANSTTKSGCIRALNEDSQILSKLAAATRDDFFARDICFSTEFCPDPEVHTKTEDDDEYFFYG